MGIIQAEMKVSQKEKKAMTEIYLEKLDINEENKGSNRTL
jgi:hypothetical protein